MVGGERWIEVDRGELGCKICYCRIEAVFCFDGLDLDVVLGM